MRSYKPAEHETTSVAPPLHFFELVHIGDTIRSVVQVYFDKQLVRHLLLEMQLLRLFRALYIDRTDFLNGAVREQKRFENVLDDSVANGLNVGTELLMNQVASCLYGLYPRISW